TIFSPLVWRASDVPARAARATLAATPTPIALMIMMSSRGWLMGPRPHTTGRIARARSAPQCSESNRHAAADIELMRIVRIAQHPAAVERIAPVAARAALDVGR